MRAPFAFMLISSLAGCDSLTVPDWQRAPSTHTCAPAEMARVERETAWCVGTVTDRTASYCYGAAILRNCQERKPS